MSSWFSTRQINIILSYQHICNNQIIWRMFQCVGQHRYLFSVSSLIMEAILASDVVPLSECLLLKKKISRTLSLFFLPGYEKFTEALSLNILTDHYSPQAWIHSYCSTLTESRSLFLYNCTKFLHCRNCFFKQFNFSPWKWINQKWVPYASVKISKKKHYTLSDGTPWLSRNLNVAGFIIPPTPLAAHLT